MKFLKKEIVFIVSIVQVTGVFADTMRIEDSFQEGNMPRVEVLQSKEVDAVDADGNTALQSAVVSGDAQKVEQLLQKGATVDAQNNEGYTALSYALTSENIEIVKQLLSKRASVEIQDTDGNSMLHIAALNGSHYLAGLLLEQGASVRVQDNEGYTPLHLAAEQGELTLVNLLLKRGVLLNMQNDQGETALHRAVMSGNAKVVGLLLRYGALADVKNNIGQVPLDLVLSSSSGANEMRSVLKSAVGDLNEASNLSEYNKVAIIAYWAYHNLLEKMQSNDKYSQPMQVESIETLLNEQQKAWFNNQGRVASLVQEDGLIKKYKKMYEYFTLYRSPVFTRDVAKNFLDIYEEQTVLHGGVDSNLTHAQKIKQLYYFADQKNLDWLKKDIEQKVRQVSRSGRRGSF